MRLENMTWPKIQAYFSVNDGVIITIWSIECHGRHLPVGTDTLISEKLLEIIEDQTSMMISPKIPFGKCPYFVDFPGTINTGEEILYPLLLKIATSLYKAGARRFIFLNWHGGNIKPLKRIEYVIQREKKNNSCFKLVKDSGRNKPGMERRLWQRSRNSCHYGDWSWLVK